jgi:GT2 family glycosyltransferase
MNSYFEILIFKLYYKMPFFSYQRKRRLILLAHHHLKFLTKHTTSYQIYKRTASQTGCDESNNQLSNNYTQWIKKYDYLLPKESEYLQKIIKSWPSKPLFSIFMRVSNTEEQWLRATIESVIAQIYPCWELYIAEGADTQNHLSEILNKYIAQDCRIKLVSGDALYNNSIAAFNAALKTITGEFITFINQQDLLAPHALFWIVLDILGHPESMLWYSDEDKIDESGKRKEPFFKPDWNPDLFLSYPYNLLSHLGVYRTCLVRELNGFREGYESAQEYDLALRAIEKIESSQIQHIPRILYHCREITTTNKDNAEKIKSSVQIALNAVNDHLKRQGTQAQAVQSTDNLYIRIRYQLPEQLPLVTLIIPTYNSFKLLSRCIESIIKKTSYSAYEIIIVNNNSDDKKTLKYLEKLHALKKIKVLDYPYPFNYSAINNMATKYAQGELIGLLNNDVEVINHDWLAEMVSHALRPNTGAVGARLWYKNDTLQHGGVILGIGGVANHAHKGLTKGDMGYFGRANLIQNFSAATGACLVLRKDYFTSVGGFDEAQLAVSFNDVDLCLKLTKLGLRIIWTPYAELYHYESASRGYDDTAEKILRSEKEIAYMQKKWGDYLLKDPAYNPNLTLETEDFNLSWPPRINRLPINHG